MGLNMRQCNFWKTSFTWTAVAALLACAASMPVAKAATAAKKTTAIDKGLAYLYKTQEASGNWNSSGYEQAATGAAAFAFLSQQDRSSKNADQYQTAIDKAIAYLLGAANTFEVSTRKDGSNVCPGQTRSCNAVYWFGNARSAYATGLVAPAVAAYGLTKGPDVVATTTGPLAGMTWAQIAQGITNALAISQNVSGSTTGGWGSPIPGAGEADSSNTQWAVISLIYNETLGAITPEAVKNELRVWLHNVQNASGAACAQPGAESCSQADTGSWLLAMKFVDAAVTDPQMQAALTFLNADWQSDAATPTNAYGQPYAMWTVYKGLATTIGVADATHITSRTTDCGADAQDPPADSSRSLRCSWLEDYIQWLVDNQRADGSWSESSTPGDPIAVAFCINILGSTPIPVNLKVRSSNGKTESKTKNATPRPEIVNPAALLDLGQTKDGRPAVAAGGNPAASSKVRKRDRKGVTAIAVSEDGSALASAGTDKRIVIWGSTTGLQRATLKGSVGLPTGLVFSRGGVLSSVGRDSFLRIWDGTSGRELATLSAHEGAINVIAASPDGNLLASAGEETRIMLWDQVTRKLRKILFASKDFVDALCFSPDSRLLASGSDDGRVLLFDVATGKVLLTLVGHTGAIDAVAFHPSGTVLASAGQDFIIRLWDVAQGEQRRVLTGHVGPIRTIAFSPNGSLLASAGEDKQIMLWNVATGALEQTLTSSGVVNSIVFDPLGTFVASATEAGDITLWSVLTGTALLTIQVPGAS
jgi:WD40 repeat protein